MDFFTHNNVLWATLIFLGVLATVFGLILAIIARQFYVKTDPKVDEVEELLAHAHCGACGYAGCRQYAEAVVNNPDVPPDLCTPAGCQNSEMIAKLLGKSAAGKEPIYAFVRCQGSDLYATRKFSYEGVRDCTAAVAVGGGDKTCPSGCLGYGTCARACPFDALSMSKHGLPIVDRSKCVGCRKCEKACPRKIIEMVPASAKVVVACLSKDKGPATKKYCKVGCIGCSLCVKACKYDAVHVTNNLAKIDQDKCTSCQACVAKCPTKAILSMLPAVQSAPSAEDNQVTSASV